MTSNTSSTWEELEKECGVQIENLQEGRDGLLNISVANRPGTFEYALYDHNKLKSFITANFIPREELKRVIEAKINEHTLQAYTSAGDDPNHNWKMRNHVYMASLLKDLLSTLQEKEWN